MNHLLSVELFNLNHIYKQQKRIIEINLQSEKFNLTVIQHYLIQSRNELQSLY
ncbi:hypothetical protein BTBSAS_120015 [Brochothrix thermosphacta]|uniref:Uncharacterized protein n=1 Tax=Brochothrix thermosphacta TaxID=2756 RepID=A0A2X0QE12_BROTH|nr:hypothetical protein BTBSAS_120015 [Brochothrix thermosphacta]